ncbi:MAG: hypothetical protein LBG19_09300 [Prevotellaceae bacterium]|jgi:chromosomal replication initiation ATPase DnaA|nr:hypothetical protein [Prevotellaceae bacterium]
MNVGPYVFPGLDNTDMLEHILRMCCNAARVEREQAVSSSRLKEVVMARQFTTYRLKEIGALVNHTHSSVVHHLNLAKDYIRFKDSEFMKLFNRIA